MSVRPESWWFRATANHCLPFRPPTDARRGGSWNPNRTILVDTDSEWRNVAHQSVAAETSPYHSRSHYTGRREKQALRSAVVSCQASSGERFGFFFCFPKTGGLFFCTAEPNNNQFVHTYHQQCDHRQLPPRTAPPSPAGSTRGRRDIGGGEYDSGGFGVHSSCGGPPTHAVVREEETRSEAIL